MNVSDWRCRMAAHLPGGGERFGVLEPHRSTCLRCQAEMARRRRMERQLRALADVTVAAPAGLAARVMAGLDTPRSAVAHAEPVATSWAVPALAAAGAAVALAIARRLAAAV